MTLLIVPIVWWRKPYEGLDGHGASPKGRCEGSPESSEVSSVGKLSVFSKSPIGTFGTSFITDLWMLPSQSFEYYSLSCHVIDGIGDTEYFADDILRPDQFFRVKFHFQQEFPFIPVNG
jgi:hypothetical protein